MSDFLKWCATELDQGVSASKIMEHLRQRYTTVNCRKVKACLIRQLCREAEEYTISRRLVRDALVEEQGEEAAARWDSGETVSDCVGRLPPRLPANVREFTITRGEVRQCKREAAQQLKRRHAGRTLLDGRRLLVEARHHVRHAVECPLPELALSLMLLTGRRTCEILNGTSVFCPDGEYSMVFTGQAKKKKVFEPYEIPVLCSSQVLLDAIAILRSKQDHVTLDNRATSRRYQSRLSRTKLSHFQGRVHGLRGVYVCMALSLFRWDPRFTPNHIAMSILGHCDLEESLAYCTYFLGDGFSEESNLGEGRLREWTP